MALIFGKKMHLLNMCFEFLNGEPLEGAFYKTPVLMNCSVSVRLFTIGNEISFYMLSCDELNPSV